MIKNIKRELKRLGSPERAKISAKFFKTGKGEYGEGDIFLGLKVPEIRTIAKNYLNLNFKDLEELLSSKIHEHRLIALLILTLNFNKLEINKEKKCVVKFYLKNTKKINNWDLVDLSAHQILGNYLLEQNKDKPILYKLARSYNLWERRISIIATYAFIKENKFEDTLKISEILLRDKHDLIQKAVGWMLREVGKRNQDLEEEFLRKYYKEMPRTMLRYSIERFDEKKRRFYLTL